MVCKQLFPDLKCRKPVKNLRKRVSKQVYQLHKINKMNDINIKKPVLRFLIFTCFILYAFTVSAQTKEITIKRKSISLKDAFNEVEKQTGYSIAYGQSKLDVEKKISLALEKADLNIAMNHILEGTNHTYKLTGYHIILYPVGKKEKPAEKPETLLTKPTQTIRGVVLDSKTHLPVEFASVALSGMVTGSSTDSLGRFRIDNIPVGRYNVKASFVGYNSNIITEVLVTSSKEVYLEIPLTENALLLSEVVIRPDVNKRVALNPMALTGGRMISMEEAGRFANGFDDPARLVSAFAGVAGDPGSNGIAIRGNSPAFTQWRLEGVEIPNPTHFADITELGGGLFSGLSSSVMGNSDFYNGAFPAEYSNALSGVFDMQMRTSNNQNYEHSAQVGLMGIDVASEGPISKKRGSSYIVNYRYSLIDLAEENTDLKYQDLSFKFNFPTPQAGTFSFWGLALIDKYKYTKKEDMSDWETQSDRMDGDVDMEKLVGGLSHKIGVNGKAYLQSVLAVTYASNKGYADQFINQEQSVPIMDMMNRKWDISLNSYINTRFSDRHVNRSGITITQLMYDLDYRISPDFGLNKPAERISKGDGESTMFSTYSSSIIDLSRTLSMNLGVTGQYFRLNDNWTIEPRVSLKWQMKPHHSLAAAYGFHSRRENLDYYFVTRQENNGKKLTNKYLDFAKSHHFGLSYNWAISPSVNLKIEPYYQRLFNVPVEEGTSFSTINHIDFYIDRILVNEGSGKNYGIDITLEQYMKKGFYYMFTGSIYRSRYKGGDGLWRNTRLDRNFIFNALAGKEWMVGKHKQNMFSFNVRLFAHGGDRYSPIDMEETIRVRDITYDETRAYSEKFDPAVNGDVSVSYKINKKKISHEFSLKALNIGGYTGAHYYEFNEKTNSAEKKKSIGTLFNAAYKIQF